MVITREYLSPIGRILISGEGEALTGLWFEGQKYYAEGLSGGRAGDLSVLDEAENWLDIYFSGRDPGTAPPVKISSTPFRERVFEILMTIPYGETMTYGEIASIIAKERGGKMSAQAVGGAVGHNPVSIIVPCHRVVGAAGQLTGYAGGTERKKWLIELERGERVRRRHCPELF